MKIVVILAVLLIGCMDKLEERYQIKCDTGFDTGVVEYTYMHQGIIYWEGKQRRMESGETCERTRHSS